MIFYFTGTGNSLYAAKHFDKELVLKKLNNSRLQTLLFHQKALHEILHQKM